MKPGRNDPCPCGSGKKYKKCCQEKSEFNPPTPEHPGKGVAPTAAECNQLVALLNAGYHAELETRTRSLLERYPDSWFAWKMLGASLQMQGKDSLHALQKAAKLLPDDAEVHNNLGLVFQERGRLDEADTSYRRALQVKPDYAAAHYNLGNILTELGRTDEAEASYRRAIQTEPGNADAHYNLGNTLTKLGRLDEAGASYRRALQIRPDFANAHYNLGNTSRAVGRLDDAAASYRRALKIKPDFTKAHSSLGIVFQELGRLNEAEASYRQALQIKPDDAVTHYNLGLTLQELGRLDEAETSYRQALQIKPDYAEAHINLGFIFQKFGRLNEAEASYRQALQIKPDYVEAHINLGITLKDLGRLDEAEASYRRALEIQPNYAEAHSNLGNTLKDLGRLDEAVASYRRALQIKPDYADVHGNLGIALKAQGKLDEALACFQQQVRLTPGNDVAQHQIASLAGTNTERAPIQYVENVFDGYADKFDTHLQQVLKYEAPEKLVALITQHATSSADKWNVLDLGCGTGLVGSAIAPFARQLVGVDLSAKMLEKARARNLYQRLERLDLLTMMRAEKASSYDVIIAADVFVYLGKLDEIISETKRLLCPGGVFAFSIEALGALSNEKASQGTQRDYQLENTGRYSHSSNYITRLASANGFLTLEMGAIQLRMEHDKPINGYLVLWKS